MGRSHHITRYFIIHPLILIVEWNVQLIAPKQQELALTCLPTHSHPPHTSSPPAMLPKSYRAFTNEKDELRQRKYGWKPDHLYGNTIGCPKSPSTSPGSSVVWAPILKLREREQPGAQVPKTQQRVGLIANQSNWEGVKCKTLIKVAKAMEWREKTSLLQWGQWRKIKINPVQFPLEGRKVKAVSESQLST